jgi:acetyltransferase-like isoleucine patch superfamily enzyme
MHNTAQTKNNGQIQKWEDLDATSSDLSGVRGFLETQLRRYRVVGYLIALIPLYLLGTLVMAISITPGIIFFDFMRQVTKGLPEYFRLFLLAWTIIAAYFVYGFTLIFVVPFFNFILPFRIKPFRGGYYSISSIPWYIHNALTYIVRYTFLEFVTPTPLNPLFYRMMGMKIGKRVHINTTNISDPALIEIEDGVTIGGSAHIVAHYASKGYLVVKPVKIRKKATIGLKATIMGDVEIGEGAVIGPHEVVLPKSRVPAGRKPDKSNNA